MKILKKVFKSKDQALKSNLKVGLPSEIDLTKIIKNFEDQAIETRKKEIPNLIFISYKTEYITIARQLAEFLLSNGFNVWLDEYMISLTEFRKLFWERIDEGIALCSKAIFLTNELYWRSNFCVYEASNLLKRISDYDRIYNIECPLQLKHWNITNSILERATSSISQETENLKKRFPKNQVIDSDTSINEILQTIKNDRFLQYDISDIIKSSTYKNNENRLLLPLANVSFDIQNWERQNIAALKNSLPIGSNFDQWVFSQEMDNCELLVHILESGVDKKQRPLELKDFSIDDKDIFLENLNAAEAYLKASNMLNHDVKILGVHLILLLNLSHFAITYLIQNSSSYTPPILMRKYILTFPAKNNKNDIEIVITVRVLSNKLIDFKEFQKYVPLFDQFIYSIKNQIK